MDTKKQSLKQYVQALFTTCGFCLFWFVLPPVHAQPIGESPDGPEAIAVYLTETEALQKAFPLADTIWSTHWLPDDSQRKKIEQRLSWRLNEPHFTIYQARKNKEHLGFAVITEQVGLYKPITFLVKVDIEGQVDGVWVMVYRESRGDEVRRQRFLSQYNGKKAQHPIRLNRDIIGITGATLSVRALNAGVKKVLTIIEIANLQQDSP